MRNFTEYDRNTFINDVNSFVTTLTEKLLPNLSDEALSASAPNINTEEDMYEHIISYISIRQDLINISSVWLYHLFERHYDKISSCHQPRGVWDIRNKSLKSIGLPVDQGSNYEAIQTELRLIANAHKHGKFSKAAKELNKKLPHMCTIKVNKMFNNSSISDEFMITDFTLEQLNYYSSKMIGFWHELYEAKHKPCEAKKAKALFIKN